MRAAQTRCILLPIQVRGVRNVESADLGKVLRLPAGLALCVLLGIHTDQAATLKGDFPFQAWKPQCAKSKLCQWAGFVKKCGEVIWE